MPDLPFPIAVVLSDNKDDVFVTITNLTTNETMTGVTNASGEVVFDANNFESGYTNGDRIKAEFEDYNINIKYSIQDADTGQYIRRERDPSGTGRIADLTPFYSAGRIKIELIDTSTDGVFKLHILYKG